MFRYGKASTERLNTVDLLLRQTLVNVLDFGIMDIVIVYGARGKEDQNGMFEKGLSKLKWPNSKHNIRSHWDKSLAIDVAPFVNGTLSRNYPQCCYLAGLVMAEGERIGIKIRWGGDWDMDGEAITDQNFQDLYHFERLLEG